MTEETAISIAEALESIDGSIRIIGVWCSIVFIGVAILAYILMKD